MALHKYLQRSWLEPSDEIWFERLIQWRKEPVTLRIDHPTRLDRAKALGYKAKPGVIVVRQRVGRGGRMRPKIRAGRRSKHNRRNLQLAKNLQAVAEIRAAKKFPNLEVMNSYFVAKDGIQAWYEVLMLDPKNPVVASSPEYSWVTTPSNRSRVYRGLTSAARKGRGLLRKGRGAEKIRPSLRSHGRKGTS